MEINEGRKQALATAMAKLDKSYGKGSVMRLGETTTLNVSAIPTGAMALDAALGIGGIPRGRIVEVFGTESSGKTTLALSCAAQAQKLGGVAAIIDVEHALDPDWARTLGIDVDNLLVAQPDTGEVALAICDELVRSGAVDLVIVDSVAALVPKAEIDGDMGDSHMGLQARLMSQALRKLGGNIGRSKACVVFINQLREKIGVMFGNPEITPGGRALKYWASVRIEVRRGEPLKDGTTQTGFRTKAKIVKNKVAPPFRQAEYDLLYGEGLSHEGGLLDVGVERDVVQRNGAFLSFDGTKLGQGRENARKFLKENPEIARQIEERIRYTFSVAGQSPEAMSGVEAS